MAANPTFPPALFKFLKELKRHNDRDWFKANKSRYEAAVRGPALAFIEAFEKPLHKISPAFVADARNVGGSLFRINRDTRFAKDKSPYKTNSGIQFRHQEGKDAHAPGFYLHLEPGSCFAGVGIWHPDGATAKKIREAIVADSKGWKRAVGGKSFKAAFALAGESLKRPPRGFDADHPLIEDLKRKDFIASTKLSEKQITAPTFFADFAKLCRAGAPLIKFLSGALDLDY